MTDWSSASRSTHLLEAEITRLSSQLEVANTRIAALEAERRELKKVFAQLVQRLTEQRVLDDSDGEWVAEYLQPPGGGRGEPIATAAARAAHRVIGKIRCKCGAMVDDVAGVTDERCGWCGERLTTRR